MENFYRKLMLYLLCFLSAPIGLILCFYLSKLGAVPVLLISVFAIVLMIKLDKI